MVKRRKRMSSTRFARLDMRQVRGGRPWCEERRGVRTWKRRVRILSTRDEMQGQAFDKTENAFWKTEKACVDIGYAYKNVEEAYKD